LFTFFAPNVLSNDTNSPKFYFHSVVDMGLQSTTPGEVTNKNQILLDSLGVGIEATNQAINAIPKCKNLGKWLMFFGQTSSTGYQEKLFILKVDSTGYSFTKRLIS